MCTGRKRPSPIASVQTCQVTEALFLVYSSFGMAGEAQNLRWSVCRGEEGRDQGGGGRLAVHGDQDGAAGRRRPRRAGAEGEEGIRQEVPVARDGGHRRDHGGVRGWRPDGHRPQIGESPEAAARSRGFGRCEPCRGPRRLRTY